MIVIPSRADREGPHSRSAITHVIVDTFGTNRYVEREAELV